MRSPENDGADIHQIKNILYELKKKVDVYPIWVIFNSDKILKHEEPDEKIILFNEYSDDDIFGFLTNKDDPPIKFKSLISKILYEK